MIDNHIKLPKLGLVRLLKVVKSKGELLNATIRRNPSGKYFVSLATETEVKELPKTNSAIGIDVGLKRLCYSFRWYSLFKPKIFPHIRRKVSQSTTNHEQTNNRWLNWYKAKRKVARIHEKIANTRKDYLHKISTEIVKNHDIIGMEDLSVYNMLKNHKLAKAISEVSWSQFKTMIEYKAKWYGKQFVTVAKNFPSSQLCSAVAIKTKTLKISDCVNGIVHCAILITIEILTQV